MTTPKKRIKVEGRSGVAAMAILLGLVPTAAFSATWSQTTAGTHDWNNDSNWGGSSFPNATGASADISADYAGAVTINLNEAITIGSLTINDTGSSSDSAVTIAGNGGNLTFTPSSGNASITSIGTVNNIISADVAFGSGNVSINTGSSSTNTAVAKLTMSGAISGSGTITVSGSTSNSGKSLLDLSGSNSGFSGNWILAGSSTSVTSYDGAGAGLLVNSDAALGAVPSEARTQITIQSTSAINVAANVTLNANRGIGINSGATLILIATSTTGASGVAGDITGAGNVFISSGASGRVMVLSGNNTYTGNTTVRTGTLRAGSTNAFGTDSAVSLVNNSQAQLQLNNYSNTIGSLSGGGASGGNVALGNATLTTGTKNTDTTYAGIISGTGGGLTKTGTGVFTLTGTNTYTGATTINGGSLIVDGSLAAGSAVSVNNSGTLGGAGTIGGFTTINAGGKLSAGSSSAATLTFNGALNISGAANDTGAFVFDLGTAFDKIVAGSLTIGTDLLGSTDFSFNIGAGFAADQSYTLFQTTSGITGSFSAISLTDIGGIGVSGTISIADNNIVLTTVSSVIPEPTSFAMLGGLSAIGFAFARRRRA